MTEKAPTDYRKVIKDNFHTSGPDIGRTKNTELAVTMAKNERRARTDPRYQSEDYVARAAAASQLDARNRHEVVRADPTYEHLILDSYMQKEEVEAAGNIQRRVEGDYNKLEAAQKQHDSHLLAEARDREVNENAAVEVEPLTRKPDLMDTYDPQLGTVKL